MKTTQNSLSTAAIDSLNALSSDTLRFKPTFDLLRIWTKALEAGPDDRFPGFDPLDAGGILGHLYLLERDGERLRYRVAGEALNDLFGSNHGGRYVDEVIAPSLQEVVEPFYHAVLRGTVCVFKGKVIVSARRNAEFERILLPIHRGGTVQILGSLSVSGTAPLRDDGPIPPASEKGYHFVQIDPVTGHVTRTTIPHADLPVDQLPYEDHLKRQPQSRRA